MHAYEHDHDAAKSLLSNPSPLLPLFFDGANADFFFYTSDLEHYFRYLGDSAKWICGIDPAKWVNRNCCAILTDHPCNQHLKDVPYCDLRPDEIQKFACEIFEDGGSRVMLEIRRRLVIQHDTPIGIVAVAKRASEPVEKVENNEEDNPFSCLTAGEMEVIELVIDGKLNKVIAKRLGVSVRTVELRRAKTMTKLSVLTVPALVKLWCKHHQI
jgi:DNA-binding CsgD family transcriptional regulator